MDTEKSPKAQRIIAYGFDELGFELPNSNLRLGNVCNIEYIKFEDFSSLNNVDGLIIPQGIFEKFEMKNGFYGPYTEIYVDEDLLLEVERHVNNLIEKGKWVCFLVGQINDEVPDGNYRKGKVRDTDLCKRILNKIRIGRKVISGTADVEHKSDEFSGYIKKYGVAKTILFTEYNCEAEVKVIATLNKFIVGIDIENTLFFLPFHTTQYTSGDLNNLVTTLTNSVLDYRQKHIVEIPDWISDFRFGCEKSILDKIREVEIQLKSHRDQLEKWQQYKTILTTSGDILKDQVVEILESFFHLTVNPIDEFKEDAKVIDEYENIQAIIEVKGTKKGVKREHINQVDSHRERNHLSNNIPGILIINNEMDVSGIDERFKTSVESEHIKHAKNMNVLIIRTIDLLILIRQLEGNELRKDIFLDIMKSGGGILKVNENDLY